MPVHILTLVCPDRPGIVASISQGLVELDANILENAQFSDQPTNTFVMRTRFETPVESSVWVEDALEPRSSELGATVRVRREDQRQRVIVLVSKYDHCLVDLLYRWRAGELAIDIPVVVSNHPDLRDLVVGHGIAFEELPPSKDEADARLLALADAHHVDLVVLARYMQVLSEPVCRALAGRLINIHHSFLPGFKGAKPYHQAWQRGVKLIGATAHYVTADLDEGPIIDQDVARVSHAHTPEQMLIIGRDLERLVLSRAVKAHAEGRVFLLGRRTVVFS
ncbi:MAG: formyltetrahydrofolate deformylase [Actinomycetota bacterium]|jgi:formyltetrahydrofolate deformylase|nr:formyltetrahydrofolate deformylase [Actinomycetota bacterium]MEA2971810.1 formyltetrahydrofolate deformylase [Actinomycetota bacterium]